MPSISGIASKHSSAIKGAISGAAAANIAEKTFDVKKSGQFCFFASFVPTITREFRKRIHIYWKNCT